MNAEKFEKLCKELLDKSNDTLFNKAKEYASDEDRLANFRQPTAMMGMSTAEVCLMYQMKHIASIAKIAKESSDGILPPKELLQEKCQDMLNYTLIFYAAMCELLEGQDPPEPPEDWCSNQELPYVPDMWRYFDPSREPFYGPTYWQDTSFRGGVPPLHDHNSNHFQ